jgi:signal transduction histidine kinase
MRNAMQAVGEQGTIRVETSREGNWVVIRVSDSGVGIPKSALHRIFDPFYSTKKNGSGLGLPVVHQIVTGHGGHITVESELGVGTTFGIKLPVERGTPG